ncbi:MAG: rRNA maturation RNase YbeY [Spirochaetes bacterium]|nr:rRNA maturation RNase YbeY [Spirochaetota bacterium]
MVRIEIFCEGISLPYEQVTQQQIRKTAAAAAERLDLRNASISIIISDDNYIRTINKEFRGHDEPTDVISFSNRENPFPSLDAEQEEIGDIYISIERASRQSRECHVTLPEEVKRLVIHGMLHLLGYDHERSDEDEELMLQKEEELFDDIPI